MLAGNLVDMAWGLGVRDRDAGLRIGIDRPQIGESAAAGEGTQIHHYAGAV